ncbi:MAG: dehypoxanthine futalosine cyclase [Verrucomicrobia bacterium]|nr:dehypoxanthine futalosine cyclase [Verrucomicrobiota bacterium]
MTETDDNDRILEKAWDGDRLSCDEAERLFYLPLHELGRLADHRRNLAKAADYDGAGDRIVTYIIDRNINYTNVCSVGCSFCAFYRREGAPDAYVIGRDELAEKIRETVDAGGAQIMLQGGQHPGLPMDWYLELLRFIKEKFPGVNVHGFSPSEFIHFRELFRKPLREILRAFVDAGLGSIPGGGAEVLVDRVRREVSPGKACVDDWLSVMEEAHAMGLRTTATMMFGQAEDLRDRIEHMRRIRDLQDRTGGFTAFICWTFQPENTRLGGDKAGPQEYLRTQALARIFLDNFRNVQSSWVTQGPEVGQLALKFGANDLGSIMLEENVVSSAGTSYRMTAADMERLISELGYEPRRRNVLYELVADSD